MTWNFQGCIFLADGALATTVDMIRCITSLGTGVLLYFLILRLLVTTVENSISAPP
jgi:hypothetical protein